MQLLQLGAVYGLRTQRQLYRKISVTEWREEGGKGAEEGKGAEGGKGAERRRGVGRKWEWREDRRVEGGFGVISIPIIRKTPLATGTTMATINLKFVELSATKE
jgi:hypothetical protein